MRLPFAFAAAIFAFPVVGQDLSDDQIRDIFVMQRDAFRAARAGDLGATRGLEMITVEDLQSQPDTAPAATSGTQPGDGGAVTIAGGTEGTGPAAGSGVAAATPANEPPVVPVVYGDLPPELTIEMQVTFGFDSATIAEDQVPKLARLCSVMKTSGVHLFRIIGHTDSTGSDDYNERLSQLRAQEVRRYFISDCGMRPESLEAIGLGERFPSVPDDTRAPQNRRVEFQALV